MRGPAPGPTAPRAPLTVFSIFSVCLSICLSIRPAVADPDIRLPPGTRADASGVLISGRGLRETTDFLAKELAARGITVRQVGPYRVRGVELTRFLSHAPSTPWLAIHVLRVAGKTSIFFVLRPKP